MSVSGLPPIRIVCALLVAALLVTTCARGEDVPAPVAASHFGTPYPPSTVDTAPMEDFGGKGHRPWWMLSFIRSCHGDPNHPHRHVGLGHPLEGTSWLNRPWHASAFVGSTSTGALTQVVTQGDTGVWGFRLGNDCDHYWGWEARCAFSEPTTTNGNTGDILGTGTMYFYDVSLLFYPWGDARWRPYLTAGLGMANVRFNDERDIGIAEALVHIPFGLGLKYQLDRWLALRFEFMDELVFGSANIRTMNGFSLTGGVEIHFGGWRRRYFPYQ
jgi:hypothetical protein